MNGTYEYKGHTGVLIIGYRDSVVENHMERTIELYTWLVGLVAGRLSLSYRAIACHRVAAAAGTVYLVPKPKPSIVVSIFFSVILI